MSIPLKNSQFAVIGLGRFGLSIVKTLSEYNVNILACDKDPGQLHNAVEYATHVVQADISDESAVERLGLGNFDVVIIALGIEFEASVLATMMAKEHGAKHVVVKARGERQKTILTSIGADQVVLPEVEMGSRIARALISPNILDVLEDSEHYTISEMRPMDDWVDKSLRQADIRRKHDIMVLAILRHEKMIIPVSPDHVLAKEDVLITLTEHQKHK